MYGKIRKKSQENVLTAALSVLVYTYLRICFHFSEVKKMNVKLSL